MISVVGAGSVQAQLRVEIRPANVRLDAGTPQQTFTVHVLNYAGLDGYSIPIFYNPNVVRLVSITRRGELTSNGGGSPVCPTNYTDQTLGVIQVDCGDLDHAAPSAADGVAFAFTLERIAPGSTGLTFNDNYALYDQDLRLRDRLNVPILGYTLGHGLVSVDRPLPAAGGMRTAVDFYTTRRDWTDVALVTIPDAGIRHRIRDNGAGGRLTAARYDVAPPGGDTSPFSDPDGTVTMLGTVGRYWELTSSFSGAHLHDLAFSYAGLSIFNPSALRLARRTITDDGTGAWQLYPASKTTVNTGAEELRLSTIEAADLTTGQYALVANPSELPVELVGFAARADGDAVALSWETASETNNARFVVEHRLPGADGWMAVGERAGRGTTTERTSYTFRLPVREPGRHAFRLQQIDTDGTVTLSPVVEVSRELDEPYRVLMRSANPVRQSMEADVYVAHAQTLRVSVFDVTGREVALLHDGPVADQARIPVRLDATAMRGGTYWLRGLGEQIAFTVPFVVLP